MMKDLFNNSVLLQIAGFALIVYLLCCNRSLVEPKLKNQKWNGVSAQTNSYSCGASSLSMIFESHKIKVPLTVIEKAIIKKGEGCSFLDIKDYAKSFGLHANGWNLTIEQLTLLDMPSIVILNGSHFIVLDSISLNMIYIRDPLRGSIVLSKDQFMKSWGKNALEFKLAQK